jgi:hypothetical protein
MRIIQKSTRLLRAARKENRNGSNPTTDPAVTRSSAPTRNWWHRNWKWFVPTGCFAFLALVALFVVGILLLVFGCNESSDVYRTAITHAKADEGVRRALRTEIHAGLFVSGSTSVTGSTGNADLAIPIAGSKGKGTIYVIATKSAGEWQYTTLVVKTQSGETIDLNTRLPQT